MSALNAKTLTPDPISRSRFARTSYKQTGTSMWRVEAFIKLNVGVTFP